MSYEDYYDDNDSDYHDERVRFWQARDGRRYLPHEMETSHLENILNMVIRNLQIKLLCKFVTQGKPHYLEVASSPARMRTRLLLVHPILMDIEAELIRRRRLNQG